MHGAFKVFSTYKNLGRTIFSVRLTESLRSNRLPAGPTPSHVVILGSWSENRKGDLDPVVGICFVAWKMVTRASLYE